MLTPSDFRTDKSVRKRRPAVTFVHISVHGLCDRNMGPLPASNRHFTVSLHEVFTCYRSVASISQHVYQIGRKVKFTRSFPLFLVHFPYFYLRFV